MEDDLAKSTASPRTPQPWHVGQMTARCRERGLFVVPIFYPVVPMNSPRIRITLIATLTDEDIEHSLKILAEVGHEVGVMT